MLDTPVDSLYAWLGVAAVATAALGTAFGLPTAPPPDATAAANVVDRVAAAEPPAAAEVRLAADRATVGPRGVVLRSDAGVAHAPFAFDSVVAAGSHDQLVSVARGEPPSAAFGSSAAFADAVRTSRTGDRAADAVSWSSASAGGPTATLFVAHVAWGDTEVTLVHVE
ncbi:DUF7283 family protein [Halobaculum sp. P14]|uniref:DUF7283 family protein n=1 Tax=Halobaculum sp. P14 TaxID=3421638 RepID=UPI003EB7C5BD